MSFSFTAIGHRDDVVKQIETANAGRTADAGRYDGLGKDLAGLLAKHIGASGSQYNTLAYYVEVSGHSGAESAVSLSVTVRAAWLPLPEPQADDEYKITPLGEAAAAEDGRQAEVLAAIDKFESDLGFTAPELFPDRVRQLRARILDAFEPVVDADIADDEDDEED